jgi:hypothetical protein
MTLAASFLGGAKDRLLPASVPFRFFITAAAFHIVAWIVLFAGADQLSGFIGGPGLVLSALHLLTIGVLAMTVMGASYQLLPVATRHPLSRNWPAILSYWLTASGTAVLAVGMVDTSPAFLYSGGAGVSLGLLIFMGLTADNLWRATSMPVVAAHGWAALIALAVFLCLGLSLLLDFEYGFLDDHQAIAATHMILAVFGFMGLFAFGFSQILIPMFVLSRSLPLGLSWLEFCVAACAVLTSSIGLYFDITSLTILAAFLGLAATASYLGLMRAAFSTRMRKRLGLSFLLIYVSWGFLVLSLLAGLAVSFDLPIPNGATLFGFLTIVGWLLTFLLGILQRIMPFLASMHITDKNGMPPMLSQLTSATPLRIHAICHLIAVSTCSAGIVLNMPTLIWAGSACGVAGAIAFVAFTGQILVKIKSTS